MKQESDVTANYRASRLPPKMPLIPFPFLFCSHFSLYPEGIFKAQQGGEAKGSTETVGCPILQAGFGCKACLQGTAASPAHHSTHTFSCKRVRCHLVTNIHPPLVPNLVSAGTLLHSGCQTPCPWWALTFGPSITWGLQPAPSVHSKPGSRQAWEVTARTRKT